METAGTTGHHTAGQDLAGCRGPSGCGLRGGATPLGLHLVGGAPQGPQSIGDFHLVVRLLVVTFPPLTTICIVVQETTPQRQRIRRSDRVLGQRTGGIGFFFGWRPHFVGPGIWEVRRTTQPTMIRIVMNFCPSFLNLTTLLC